MLVGFGEIRLARTGGEAERLVLQLLHLGIVGAVAALQVQVLSNRFVEDSHSSRTAPKVTQTRPIGRLRTPLRKDTSKKCLHARTSQASRRVYPGAPAAVAGRSGAISTLFLPERFAL